jgi:hypothetical protein
LRQVVKTFVHPDGQRKVEIFSRRDRTFGYSEWKFCTEEYSWAEVSKRTATVTDTLDGAIREAYGRVDWLKDLDL